MTYLLLVLIDQLLQLVDSSGECERVACEFAILSLNRGLAKSGSECLIDFVVGQPFSFACVLVFLGRNREGGQGFCRLPRGKINDGLPGPGGSKILPSRWKVHHCIPRSPPEDETQNQQNDQDQQG